MSELSIGKMRGLQQISTAEGIFVICAMDHRGSLRAMIEEEQLEEVEYQEIVERKVELCAALAPHASAVLLDPNYGWLCAVIKKYHGHSIIQLWPTVTK